MGIYDEAFKWKMAHVVERTVSCHQDAHKLTRDVISISAWYHVACRWPSRPSGCCSMRQQRCAYVLQMFLSRRLCVRMQPITGVVRVSLLQMITV